MVWFLTLNFGFWINAFNFFDLAKFFLDLSPRGDKRGQVCQDLNILNHHRALLCHVLIRILAK